MAETKQPYLNGAYYGPPVPPQQVYHKHSRGRGCDCGPCCLLSFLFKLIISIGVTLGIAALVFWLIYRPTRIKVYVERASLTQFNLTDSNNLHYNLTLDISVRNPNRKIGIYYDKLEARAYYDGEKFALAPLPTFYQGHKNTTMLYPAFSGNSNVILGNSIVMDFNREKLDGYFYVDVKIHARIRFKIGSLKTNRFTPEFECELRLPLTADGQSDGSFSRKKCDIDF